MFFTNQKDVTTGNKKWKFLTWPGFTYEAVSKYLPQTVATVFGHIHQERQNLQSTKVMSDLDNFPTPESQNVTTNQNFVNLFNFTQTNKAYGDLTSQFPYMSTRGYQYFLVVYDYDSNAILVELLKNRSGTEIKNA